MYNLPAHKRHNTHPRVPAIVHIILSVHPFMSVSEWVCYIYPKRSDEHIYRRQSLIRLVVIHVNDAWHNKYIL